MSVLPPGTTVARICKASSLGDNGEVNSASFVPHPGSDTRAADRALSVHWLEYLCHDDEQVAVQELREFLAASPFLQEFKPTVKGKIAVLESDRLRQAAGALLGIPVDLAHEPRGVPAASGFELDPQTGAPRLGMAKRQAANAPLVVDPHSALFTLPEEEARQLAVQQFFANHVKAVYPGKLA